jgi:hypothetical protein
MSLQWAALGGPPWISTLVEERSVQSTVHMACVAKDTILKLLKGVGQQSIKYA